MVVSHLLSGMVTPNPQLEMRNVTLVEGGSGGNEDQDGGE